MHRGKVVYSSCKVADFPLGTKNQPTPNSFVFLVFFSPSSFFIPPLPCLCPLLLRSIFFFLFHFSPWIPMVTTVKSRPPHASFAMSGRRHRSSPAAPSCSSFIGGSLLALCCLTSVLLVFSVSAAAEDCAEESDRADGDGRCLGFRDDCADQSAFCFSSSVAHRLLASEVGIKAPDLEVSREWGPSSPPLGFPMSGGGGAVTCSSVDTTLARVRNGLGRDGDAGVRHNAASCQAPLVPDNWMRASAGVPMELDGTAADVDSSGLHSSLSMNVAINPPVLDWGSRDLYAASMATLTVVNLNNDSTLRLYEPFSTDPQFYVYGFEDLELQPGDNATVTFIFLPKLLGSSSAHLVLQTNFGGFIIHAKGMAVSSPYQILPLTGIDVVIGGQLERNLSIYNPYDDTLYVEEVVVWMSSLESTRYSSHLVCQLGLFDGALELSSSRNWYAANSDESGWPVIFIRPSEQWEVLPSKRNTVIELKLQALSEGKPMIMRAVKADDTILRQWRSHGTSDGISVLADHEMMFPVVQIGSQSLKWIKVHNPSLECAAMQLVVNSEEIIDQCKTVTDVCELTFSSKSPEINSTETRFGFSLSDTAITEAHLCPSETALLGPIVFRPSNRCTWSSMVLIRNNLSGVEILPLRAYGGRQSIVLLEESKPAWKLEFNLGSNVQNKSTMIEQEVLSSLCSQQLTKEIHVKNSGDLPLEVTKVKVSGADCGVDGFTVDNCKGFSVAPSESIRMLISFQADFSSAMVQRDLELVMTTGIFPIPMTANIPVCMLNQCRKSYLRYAHWKLLLLSFGALTLLVLVFVRYTPHTLTVSSQDHYIKIDDRKSTIFEENRKSTISKTLKPSFLHQSSKKSRAIKEHKRTEEALAEKYPASVVDNSKSTDDKNSPDEQLHTTSTVSVSPKNPVEDKVSGEAPQTSENLTIRIARDKGKRRKRKVGGAGLAGKFEVSSSHSGNSTPSSPLSQGSTPKQGWSFSGAPSELKHDNKLETGFDVEATTSSAVTNREKKTWSQVAKEQPRSRSASPGTTSPSAPALTTTAWRSTMLATSSPIALRARAPGSNLVKDKAVKRGEGAGLKKDFTYDIWGDHFPANLLGIARNGAPCKMPVASEGASYSLFAREPQTLMMKPSSAPPVSRGRGSPPSDVGTGYAIK
ncbi:hypothetical protein PVAP13_9KG649600 [Panicum virgatum]|uniref:Transmembrane protein 131-like N-terminal domain-containing protein n=1 Tax=Panicum virgatum TaxID=38727 RepID=A0A8T0NXS3_PANVG|nr:hypothetical protein PVAP13_9KG649600 [Panicum virgatum]